MSTEPARPRRAVMPDDGAPDEEEFTAPPSRATRGLFEDDADDPGANEAAPESPSTGARRALVDPDDEAEPQTEVFDAPVIEPVLFDPGLPRRGPAAGDAPDSGVPGWLRPWLVVLGFGLALAMMVTAIYLLRGPQAGLTPTASPTQTPVTTTDPSPGTEPATPGVSPTASPTATGTTATPEGSPTPTSGDPVQIDDADFVIPAGWELYADEMVDGSRRLVRLREPDSDVRAQLVTLTSVSTDLTAACRALVDDQSSGYTDVVPVLPASIGIDSADGAGVTCGFAGIRTTDEQPNNVAFTLVQRASDGHSLVLRSTMPTELPADAPARSALFTMNCEASTSFGVPLPLC